MLKNTTASWGRISRSLHWLLALLISAQIALGLAAAAWRLSPLKLDLFVWHKSLGMLILLLAVLRLSWRLGNATPEPPAGTASWERLAAQAVHSLLYALMLVLPITGWVISSASNIPFRIFWLLPLPGIVQPSQELAEQAAGVHLILVLLLSLLLVIHIGAALRHHFVKRNAVLLRMLTGREARS